MKSKLAPQKAVVVLVAVEFSVVKQQETRKEKALRWQMAWPTLAGMCPEWSSRIQAVVWRSEKKEEKKLVFGSEFGQERTRIQTV